MIITALIENTSKSDNFEVEHGLSLYIESYSKTILFDMGQSNMFIRNAAKLGINLSNVNFAVLSHGHYDHGGGLKHFLQINRTASVYVNTNVFGDYYNASRKYIGLEKELSKSKRLISVDGETRIADGITLFSCNEKLRPNDKGSFGLTELVGEEYIPDKFLHEQYLLIEEDGKNVLISGCSHKGILDIVSWFKPNILIGGFHYSKIEDRTELKEAAEILNSYNTTCYTCHCTGVKQYKIMKEFMPRLNYISCGEKITL